MPAGLEPDRINTQQQQNKRSKISSKLITTPMSIETQKSTGKQNGKNMSITQQKNKKLAIQEGKIGVKRKSESIITTENNINNTIKRRQLQEKLVVVKSAADSTGSPRKQQKTIKKEANNVAAPPTTPLINNNGFNPLDNILNEIEAFDTSNKPKQKKRREKAPKIESPIENEEGHGPCSSQQMSSTMQPVPISIRPLNRTELQRQEQDNTMVQLFLHRDDLMERILAYKMLRGRVESYLTMKAKIDLNSCITPEYEIRPDLVDPVSALLHPKLEPFIEEEPPPENEPPHTHLSMQGPMTPPGSPGTNQSSTPAAGGTDHRLHHQLGIFGSGKTTQLKFEASTSSDEMLCKFGALLGVPEQKLRSILGDDLQKIGSWRTEDWLETLREALKHLARKKESVGEQIGIKISKSPAPSTSQIKEEANSLVDSTGPNRLLPNMFDQFQQTSIEQNPNTASDLMEAAMDISSESSSSSSSSGIFLPPPPAPPPMPPPNNLLMDPPPPPPPMNDEKVKMELTDDEPIPSPPPPFPLNGEPSTSEMSSISRRPIQPSAVTLSKMSRQPQRRLSNTVIKKQQRIMDQQKREGVIQRENRQVNNNNRAKDFDSIIMNENRKTAIDSPITRNLRGPHLEASMTAACARPISLLSLDIKAPKTQSESANGSNEVKPSNSPHGTNRVEQKKPPTSQFISTMPQQVHQQQLAASQKDVVNIHNSTTLMPAKNPLIMNLNMDFIKNTPPPPIPEIIRKQLPNRTEIQSFAIPIASTTSISSTKSIRPQKLMNMDLSVPRQPHLPPNILSMVHPPPAIHLSSANLPLPRTYPSLQLMPLHQPPLIRPPHHLSGPPPNSFKAAVQTIGGNSNEQSKANSNAGIAPEIASSPYGKFF